MTRAEYEDVKAGILEKAYKWLLEHASEYMASYPYSSVFYEDELADDFKKAMYEDRSD